ncbi:MAG: outer membrane beta-barrel protein [Leptospira sp.]|nr:outer membrane beta-barrel protein [Leptospira sp.]
MKHFSIFLLLLLLTSLSLAAEGPSPKANYVDLRLGAVQIENKTQPLALLSYERILGESYLIGLSAQYIRIQAEKDENRFGFARSAEISVATATLSLGYQFAIGNDWKPYIRLLGGGQLTGFGRGADLWQYGIGFGTRYFMTESIYLNLELSGSRYQFREDNKIYTDAPQLNLGIGYHF